MSAKDQIKQIVDYFKREPQLKNKTDGMAEGLLLGANLADDANELSKETDASLKALQREYTENGNGSQTTAEITVARDGEQVLDDRLKRDFGNVNAQLAQKAKQHWIDMADYFVYGSPMVDHYDYSAAVSAMGDGDCVLYFPPGKYKIEPSKLGGLLIKNKKNFTVVGWGATLYNDPLVITNDTPPTRLIRIHNCSDFNFYGFNIQYNVSWESKVSSGLTRDEQVLEVWADRGEQCDNFTIAFNTFNYDGDYLNYYPDNIVNRLSIILLASQSNDGIYEKLITNFNIHHNNFVNCLGRVIYTLLAKVGSVSNNTMNNLGRLVSPDLSFDGFAETVAFRFLASSDISGTGNVVKCYEKAKPNMPDRGNVRIFYVGNGGLEDLFSESINFNSNIVSFGNVGGWFVHLGDAKKIKIKDNNVKFMDSTYASYGLRTEEIGLKQDIEYDGNTIINPMNHYYLEEGADEDYSNINIEHNTNIDGNNTLVHISEKSKKRANFGKNYWSDKKSQSYGPDRKREVSSYRMPPLTGDYSIGDVCVNSGFDVVDSPVRKWVFQYKGAVNYWRPIEHVIYARSTPPVMPTSDNEKLQFMGLQYIESSTNKVLTWTGLKWAYPDGTLKN